MAKSKLSVILGLVGIGLLLIIFQKIQLISLLSGKIALQDFDIYYQMARDVASGAHPYRLSYMQTSGPPLVIAPYFLLAWLPLAWARSAITIINLTAGYISCYLLAKYLAKKQIIIFSIFLFVFMLLTFPARFSLLMGQPNLVVMLAVTYLLIKPSKKWSGLSASLMAIIKTQFILVWPSLLKNHKQTFIKAVLLTGFLGVLALPILKPQYYLDYLRERGSFYIHPSIQTTSTTDYYNQSLRATMNRLNLGQFYLYIWLPLLIGLCFYLIKSGDLQTGILAPFLLPPIVWQHYFIILFPLIIYLFKIYKRKPKYILILTFISIMIFTEWPFLHSSQHNFYFSLLASHFFIGQFLLILVVLLSIRNKYDHR